MTLIRGNDSLTAEWLLYGGMAIERRNDSYTVECVLNGGHVLIARFHVESTAYITQTHYLRKYARTAWFFNVGITSLRLRHIRYQRIEWKILGEYWFFDFMAIWWSYHRRRMVVCGVCHRILRIKVLFAFHVVVVVVVTVYLTIIFFTQLSSLLPQNN